MNFLTSIPSPEISYLDIGPVRIHFYALFILTGIVIASWLADTRLHARGAERGLFLDLALWAVPAGIIGGRFYHVVTHPRDYFYEGADFLAVFRIWEGGMAISGAILFGAVGLWYGAKKAGLRFWSVADAVAPGLLIAQGIGRLGNYFNQELYGLPTDLPWGLEIPFGNPAYPAGLPEGLTFHPTFLYEMIWNFAAAGLLIYLGKSMNLHWGKQIAIYFILYSTGRLWIESIRIDPSEIILGLRVNIWSALIGIAIGVTLLIVQSRRHPGLEPSIWLEGREAVSDSAKKPSKTAEEPTEN